MRYPLPLFAFLFFSIAAQADSFSSTNFGMPATALDSAGQSKQSSNYKVVDAIGQPTPTGVSKSSSYQLQAGFIPAGTASPSLSKVMLQNIINALNTLPGTGTKGKTGNKLTQAISFLNKALAELAAYQGGDPSKLVQTLIDVRQAISFMQSVSGTESYQLLLAQASQQAAYAEVARLAAAAPAGSTLITDAQQQLVYGDQQLLVGGYIAALDDYIKAVQWALQA